MEYEAWLRLARGVHWILVLSLSGPRLRIDLESGAGRSMPRFSGSTPRTDPAVPKMSSRAPGKIRQPSYLWGDRNLSGEVFFLATFCA